MRKIKEIIEEIEQLGKTKSAYLQLRSDLGQRPTPYKIFCGVQSFLDNCSDNKERKIRISRELIEIGINNSKDSSDIAFLAFLIADGQRKIKDVEWAREVIRNGMGKFKSNDDFLKFAKVIEDKDGINDKEWAAEICAGVAGIQENIDDLLFSAQSALNLGDNVLTLDILRRAAKSVETVKQMSQIINFSGILRKRQFNDGDLVESLLDLPLAKCQSFDEALLLTGVLSLFDKPKAYEYLHVARQHVSSGFDISSLVTEVNYDAGLNNKDLAEDILVDILNRDYSFDEWFSILQAAWQITQGNVFDTILQKCINAVKEDDFSRREKCNLLSQFVLDYMRDVKLSKELAKKFK